MVQTIYDILKTHGGDLKINTEQGEDTKFIIVLPKLFNYEIAVSFVDTCC